MTNSLNRVQALGQESPSARIRLEEFVELAKRGLPQMYADGAFAHTVRAVKTSSGRAVKPEGDSLRYATNVALGVSYLDEGTQRDILAGDTAAELALTTAWRARTSDDPGAVALAAWAAAEVADFYAESLLDRLARLLASDEPIATVDCSWTLIAALAARHLGDTEGVTALAADRLMEAQGPSGIFPHMLPASANGRLRAHVGCFADQVYSTQGLARLSVAQDDPAALAAAEACAARICELQGSAGQWWWHYDVRNGTVVEGYPVYSVHQHAMGPMALLDLREAGGTPHWNAMIKGLDWIDRHPEVSSVMVCEEDAVIWRKAGRREPNKAVRAVSAMTTALMPGLHLPGLDAIFPPNRIDYECRPYELGWLLYAWLSGGAVERLRAGG
ncbi:hypothetical protein XW59_007985 [Aquamicrobium sp. LC103]|nr:hypothetical protein XW59_007985 [Aquamicrobium sp. LC103]